MSGSVPYDLTGKRVWVAGHRGMVGSALVRRLEQENCEILTVPRRELDLRRQADVEQWMAARRPQAVFMTAATVGGIHANAASHVVPAMIRKTAHGKVHGGPVEIWGSGQPRREFLSVDDAADAMVHLMKCYSDEDVINIGAGEDVSIKELAQQVAEVVGYEGDFRFDTSKPDGVPRKQVDATRLLALGWRPTTPLRDGLAATYEWYQFVAE